MTLTLKLVEGHHIKVQILTKYLKCEVIYQPMSWKYTQELFRSKDIAQRCSKALQNMFKKVIKTTIFNVKMVKKKRVSTLTKLSIFGCKLDFKNSNIA